MRRGSFLLILVMVSLGVSGCASSPKPTTIVSSVATPAAGQSSTSPLSLPTSVSTVPAPSAGLGTVVVTLINKSTNQPFAGQNIFLAHLRKMDVTNPDTGSVYFAELDVKNDPNAQTDSHGRVVIQNVAPGDYGLVVWLPSLQQVMLSDAKLNQNIQVVVKADQVNDMGKLTVVDPGE